MDRLPPNSPEAEQGVLGCILLSPSECLNECVAKFRVGAEVFYDLRHQAIFNSMLELAESRAPIDVITLQQNLKDKQLLEQVGGVSFIASLPDTTPSAINATYYADVVFEKYLLRKMIHTCTDVVSRIYESPDEVDVLLDGIERDIMSVNQLRSGAQETSTKELVKQSLSQIEELFLSGGKIAGMPTGFPDLDIRIDGMNGGEVIVVAGYPGSGKTALSLNIAEHVSVVLGHQVGIFSMEMKAASLVSRFLFSNSRINRREVRNGNLSESDLNRLTTSAGKIASSGIHIDDTSDLSIYELRARARRMAQQYHIKMLVIDYIQLLNAAGGSRKVESRQQEVADISRGIKGLAQELNVPILALSQLNDDGKLRESRAIGQDADGVWRLKKKEGGTDTPQRTEVDLEIQKCRNGEVGSVPLLFEKTITRFQSVSRVRDEDVPVSR